MVFPSRDAHREFWRAHPALGKYWSDDIEDYVDYDLAGDEPELRSRVVEAAVRADGSHLLDDDAVQTALAGVSCPAVLVRAPRGLLDEAQPLLPDATIRAAKATLGHLVDVLVPDANHYLVALGQREAATVAEQIRRLTCDVS